MHHAVYPATYVNRDPIAAILQILDLIPRTPWVPGEDRPYARHDDSPLGRDRMGAIHKLERILKDEYFSPLENVRKTWIAIAEAVDATLGRYVDGNGAGPDWVIQIGRIIRGTPAETVSVLCSRTGVDSVVDIQYAKLFQDVCRLLYEFIPEDYERKMGLLSYLNRRTSVDYAGATWEDWRVLRGMVEQHTDQLPADTAWVQQCYDAIDKAVATIPIDALIY